MNQINSSYTSGFSAGIYSATKADGRNSDAPASIEKTRTEGSISAKNTEAKGNRSDDVIALDRAQKGEASKATMRASALELTEAERKQVMALSKRDNEVRRHEAAHLAAAGRHAIGGIKLELTRGPDGKSYAVGGSVGIDTSSEATPEATIQKADQIRRAALAPAEPSGQDRAVAAEATQMKLQAQLELSQRTKAENASHFRGTSTNTAEDAAPPGGKNNAKNNAIANGEPPSASVQLKLAQYQQNSSVSPQPSLVDRYA